jgi:hypothetical protein
MGNISQIPVALAQIGLNIERRIRTPLPNDIISKNNMSTSSANLRIDVFALPFPISCTLSAMSLRRNSSFVDITDNPSATRTCHQPLDRLGTNDCFWRTLAERPLLTIADIGIRSWLQLLA